MKRNLFLGGIALALFSVSGCGSRGGSVRPAMNAAPRSAPKPIAGGKLVPLSKFQVETTLLVSDPCYPLEPDGSVSLQHEIKNARSGDWEAESLDYKAGPRDVRCAELRAFHAGHTHKGACDWQSVDAVIGVDSGQAGIFERKHFGDDKVVPEGYRWQSKMIDAEQPWYSLCCDVTLSKTAGVIPFGAVAGSGFGDGGYECYVCEDTEGKVQGTRVVFITDEDVTEP